MPLLNQFYKVECVESYQHFKATLFLLPIKDTPGGAVTIIIIDPIHPLPRPDDEFQWDGVRFSDMNGIELYRRVGMHQFVESPRAIAPSVNPVTPVESPKSVPSTVKDNVLILPPDINIWKDYYTDKTNKFNEAHDKKTPLTWAQYLIEMPGATWLEYLQYVEDWTKYHG